jgi:hypothetical protein
MHATLSRAAHGRFNYAAGEYIAIANGGGACAVTRACASAPAHAHIVGIRAGIDIGPVFSSNVQPILPFKNELRFLVANGSSIKLMLEHSVENDAPSGGMSMPLFLSTYPCECMCANVPMCAYVCMAHTISIYLFTCAAHVDPSVSRVSERIRPPLLVGSCPRCWIACNGNRGASHSTNSGPQLASPALTQRWSQIRAQACDPASVSAGGRAWGSPAFPHVCACVCEFACVRMPKCGVQGARARMHVMSIAHAHAWS